MKKNCKLLLCNSLIINDITIKIEKNVYIRLLG